MRETGLIPITPTYTRCLLLPEIVTSYLDYFSLLPASLVDGNE